MCDPKMPEGLSTIITTRAPVTEREDAEVYNVAEDEVEGDTEIIESSPFYDAYLSEEDEG